MNCVLLVWIIWGFLKTNLWKRYGIRNKKSDVAVFTDTFMAASWITKMVAIDRTKYRKEADFDPSWSQNPLSNFDQIWHG